MKKKTMALGGLLMAVAITGYSVSGTYAKYISAFDLADEARVARWAFQLDGKNPEELTNYDINLFQESYEVTNEGQDAYTDVVSSEEGVKVVAPGTRGSYTFNITGTAETNYVVSFGATIANSIVEGTYDPIHFRLTDANGDWSEWMTSTEFEAYLNSEINNATSVVYAANDELSLSRTMEWVWAFEDLDPNTTFADSTYTPEVPGFVTNNKLDTKLAQKENANIKVSVAISIVQTEAKAGTTVNRGNLVDGKTIPAAAITGAFSAYDANKIANVELKGNSLVGTIQKNSALDSQYSSDPAYQTGYYYPVAVEANADSKVKVNGRGNTFIGDAVLVLTELNPELDKSERYITVEVDGIKTVIDYSNLEFAE